MLAKVLFAFLLNFILSFSKACEPPFQLMGAYCLLIDNMMTGTWSQMRGVCQALGGELVNMQDANKLYEISKYIKGHGLTDVSYWVGATDERHEGNWVWSSDNSTVRKGRPLWGDNYGEEPNGGTNENCAIISKLEFYYMHDEDCGFQYNGLICQPNSDASLASMSLKESQASQQPKECPPPYESIGLGCIYVVLSAKYTWEGGKSFCESQGGHLIKIDDANLYGAVYDYLIDHGISKEFWLDGSDEAIEDLWMFDDQTFVKRGTPFWDTYSVNIQEPIDGRYDNCLGISTYGGYFFLDGDCSFSGEVICQYDI